MPTALAAPTLVVRTGSDPEGATPDISGATFPTTGYEFLYVKNGSGSAITVTIDAYPSGNLNAPGGLTVTDPVISIPAGADRNIGPFPPSIYADSSGNVTATPSAVTDVTMQAFKFVPNPF